MFSKLTVTSNGHFRVLPFSNKSGGKYTWMNLFHLFNVCTTFVFIITLGPKFSIIIFMMYPWRKTLELAEKKSHFYLITFSSFRFWLETKVGLNSKVPYWICGKYFSSCKVSPQFCLLLLLQQTPYVILLRFPKFSTGNSINLLGHWLRLLIMATKP